MTMHLTAESRIRNTKHKTGNINNTNHDNTKNIYNQDSNRSKSNSDDNNNDSGFHNVDNNANNKFEINNKDDSTTKYLNGAQSLLFPVC